jgi:hypothetical protein
MSFKFLVALWRLSNFRGTVFLDIQLISFGASDRFRNSTRYSFSTTRVGLSVCSKSNSTTTLFSFGNGGGGGSGCKRLEVCGSEMFGSSRGASVGCTSTDSGNPVSVFCRAFIIAAHQFQHNPGEIHLGLGQDHR